VPKLKDEAMRDPAQVTHPMKCLSLLAICFLAVTGCNLAPKYSKPQVDLPGKFATSGPWRTASPRDSESRGNWWGLFGDGALTNLMKQAEAGSPTLEIAAQRVAEAQAVARADRAGLFPSADLNASAQRARGTETLQYQFAGGRTRTTLRSSLDLDYELDLWGRVKNQSQASLARVERAEADHRSVLLSLQGELAMNYFALRAQDAEISLLKSTLALRQRTLDLATVRFKQGDIAQVDVAQAETEMAATQSEAIGLEKRRAELEHAIALLIGQTASTFRLPPADLKGSPPSVPGSVPSDLLERRPDIAAAEREMAALNAEVGVAKAALFPSVRIGVTGGRESSFIGQLARSASRVWAMGPASVDWPIFDAKKRTADIEAQSARYQQAAATYRQTVLEAMRDVEDALSGLSILARQRTAQEATVAAAERAVDLSQKRYDSGLVSFYEVIDAQRTLLRSQQEATRILGEQFLSAVLLVKALGGGW